MAGLWLVESHAELANWLWAVSAGRAGAWVPVQEAFSHSCPQPPAPPSSSYLFIAVEETTPSASRAPRCEVGVGLAPAAGVGRARP